MSAAIANARALVSWPSIEYGSITRSTHPTTRLANARVGISEPSPRRSAKRAGSESEPSYTAILIRRTRAAQWAIGGETDIFGVGQVHILNDFEREVSR